MRFGDSSRYSQDYESAVFSLSDHFNGCGCAQQHCWNASVWITEFSVGSQYRSGSVSRFPSGNW